jgi:hypothetical protein
MWSGYSVQPTGDVSLVHYILHFLTVGAGPPGQASSLWIIAFQEYFAQCKVRGIRKPAFTIES